MSFRTRLITFFVLIVVMPMLAIGFLVFRLIDDSQTGKTDARAAGVATVALSVYESSESTAAADAGVLAREVAKLPAASLATNVARIQAAGGLARVLVRVGGRRIIDRGDADALAPGTAHLRQPGRPPIEVTVSELTAAQYQREVAGPGDEIVVRQGPRVLASGFRSVPAAPAPAGGTVAVAGRGYRAVTMQLPGFGSAPVKVTVFSSLAATAASTGTTRLLAVLFILGFLVLAIAFAVLSSRGLQAQLSGFLRAARRLAAGDFSSPVETSGDDEFAALGEEFNNMSRQLEERLEQLGQERERLRESLRRIGRLFASNLDRMALLNLALQTAVDAVDASDGRLTARAQADASLAEVARVGSPDRFGEALLQVERDALRHPPLAEATGAGFAVVSVVLAPAPSSERAHGLITVSREGEAFSDDDRDLLRSLAAEAAVALENVELHLQVSRQAVTDQLTGLANHGRFQEMLDIEIEQVRRYRHPLALILLDIDDFKQVNDTHGHQQGDRVLREVARVLSENSRDADVPARYGGEEMALILPHTDQEGAHAIAERVRAAVEELTVAMTDGSGDLRVSVSVGVATTLEGGKDSLIAEADAALYRAKRGGKNRVECATSAPAGVGRSG